MCPLRASQDAGVQDMNITGHATRLLIVLCAAAFIDGCSDDASTAKHEAIQPTTPPVTRSATEPSVSGADDREESPLSMPPDEGTSPDLAAPDDATASEAADESVGDVEAIDESTAKTTDATLSSPIQEQETAGSATRLIPTAAQVRLMQQSLRDAGYDPGVVDGIMGPRTVSALKSYQQQHGLAVGEVTEETLSALQRVGTK